LSAKATERVAATMSDHRMATFSWETLRHIMTQAPYLEFDRGSPTVPQSWEATATDTHWFATPAPFPDPSTILKVWTFRRECDDTMLTFSVHSCSCRSDRDRMTALLTL
jgi:hypothetical protein